MQFRAYVRIIHMMGTRFYKNEKFQKVFYGILYFILICGFVASACFAFDKLYYEHIYVSGNSMNPTLIGNGVLNPGEQRKTGFSNYGKADTSNRTIDNLKRFDVVITYFPHEWTTEDDTYKIKRVWGFPGEKIQLTYTTEEYTYTVIKRDGTEEVYKAKIHEDEPIKVDGQQRTWDLAYFTNGSKTFKVRYKKDSPTAAGRIIQRKPGASEFMPKELAADEYFLMGDNWTSSSDSYSNTVEEAKGSYIKRSDIRGKVVQIEGIAQIQDGKLINKQKIKGMYDF